MRMRTRGHLQDRIELCRPLMAESFAALPDTGGRPIHIEIGCGKGGFITQLAAKNPQIFYVAAEKVSNVLVLAMEKAKAAELKNLYFMQGNFEFLSESFPDGCVERIYLNFSDPWPKKGYAKRRLTHGGFLSIYRRILKDNGEIFFKTDNRPLFEFSLESFAENGFSPTNVTFDLHRDNPKDNIMTEYETLFSERGIPICRLEAVKNTVGTKQLRNFL